MSNPVASAALPTMRRAVRASGSAFAADCGRFAAANVLWSLTVWITLSFARAHPLAGLLAVVMVPVAAGTGRVAAQSARGRHPGWADFRAGVAHRPSATWRWERAESSPPRSAA